MKSLVILSALIASCAGAAVPRDNSHYVEGESQYIWMTNDEDQNLVLVDLWERLNLDSMIPGTGADNEYWLYTRENPTQHQLLIHGDTASVKNSNFDGRKNTKFLAHGWGNNGNSRFNVVVRDAFLAAEDCNVIVVEWSKSASGNYVRAVSGVPSTGEYLGDFMEWLVGAGFAKWGQIHLVGYSLGAHVVGCAGRRAGGRPSRVTGLDAAGPLWRLNHNALSKESGRFVEAIHTDAGLQGMLGPIANADFYPNGGTSYQPGCDSSGCSHARSYEFFALSVRENRFVGKRCDSLASALRRACSGDTLNMGNNDMDKFGIGVFSLTVTEEDLSVLS